MKRFLKIVAIIIAVLIVVVIALPFVIDANVFRPRLESELTDALGGTCPTAVDFVSYGTAATDCGKKTTPTLSNTTAAIRGDGGCMYTDSLPGDFSAATPAPRNATDALHRCAGTLPLGGFDHVTVSGAKSVIVGTPMVPPPIPIMVESPPISAGRVNPTGPSGR